MEKKSICWGFFSNRFFFRFFILFFALPPIDTSICVCVAQKKTKCFFCQSILNFITIFILFPYNFFVDFIVPPSGSASCCRMFACNAIFSRYLHCLQQKYYFVVFFYCFYFIFIYFLYILFVFLSFF